MADKKLSEFNNANSLNPEDLVELQKYEDTIYKYQTKGITIENFKNTLGANNHTIQSHTDTNATGSQLNTLTDGSNADSLHSHNTDHTIQSHIDTNATGSQLDTLTDGSNADSLHSHDLSHDIQSHTDTNATGSQLNTLTDGSNADSLHSHNTDHTIQSHTDTNATGSQLDTLSMGGNADLLHTHDLANLNINIINPYIHARIGKGSMYFNGTTNYVQYLNCSDFDIVSSNLDIWTITFWCKYIDIPTVTNYYLSRYEDYDHNFSLYYDSIDGITFKVSGIVNQDRIDVEVSSDVGYATQTWTLVQFNIENQDILNEYDNTSYKYTASEIGTYNINPSLHLDINRYDPSDNIYISIHVNGTEVYQDHQLIDSFGGGGGHNIVYSISTDLFLNVNDYVEIYTYRENTDSGNSGTIEASSSLNIIKKSYELKLNGSFITDTDWHQITLVKKLNEYGLYLDGSQVDYKQDGLEVNISADLFIGCFNFNNYYNGYIDDIYFSKSDIMNASPSSTIDDVINLHEDKWIPNENTKLYIQGDYNCNSLEQVQSTTKVSLSNELVKFGTGAMSFNGFNDYVTYANHSDWNLFNSTSNVWTISLWIKLKDLVPHQMIFQQLDSGDYNYNLLLISNQLHFSYKISNSYIYTTGAVGNITLGEYHFITIVKNATNIGLYLNGNQIGYFTTSYVYTFSADLIIGGQVGGSEGYFKYFLNGFIDEFKLDYSNVFNCSPNSSLSDSFTIPSAPLINDSSTKLHILANDDCNSSEGKLATKTTTIVKNYYKFNNSLFFNGGTDYLQFPVMDYLNITSGSLIPYMTISFWVKHNTHDGTEYYIEQHNDSDNRWSLYHQHGNGIRFEAIEHGSSFLDTGYHSEITDSNWHHIALIKVNDEFGVYLDGAQIGYTTDTNTMTLIYGLRIGSTDSLNFLNGYMDDIFIIQDNIFGALPNSSITDSIIIPTNSYSDTPFARFYVSGDYNNHSIHEVKLSEVCTTILHNNDASSEYQVGDLLRLSFDNSVDGWLLCDGSSISKVNYPDLYEKLKNGGTVCIYGETSNEFNLPDLRGLFLRGVDSGRGLDPDSISRLDRGDGATGDNIGTIQMDEYQSHQHQKQWYGEKWTDGTGTNFETDGSYNTVTSNTGGNETRPYNINVNYYIKY